MKAILSSQSIQQQQESRHTRQILNLIADYPTYSSYENPHIDLKVLMRHRQISEPFLGPSNRIGPHQLINLNGQRIYFPDFAAKRPSILRKLNTPQNIKCFF